MAKEDVVESRQPTELAHNRLVQTARDLRLELDSELEMDIGILPSSGGGGSGLPAVAGPAPPSLPSTASVKGTVTTDTKGAAVKAKAKPKARNGASEKPALVASKMRKDTTKAWNHMQAAVQEAQRIGDAMLQDCIQEHGTADDARQADQSFATVEHRVKCLRLLSNESRAKPTEESGLKILAELQQDSYFMEQGWPWGAAQTLGQMFYVRLTAIELQRTAEAVHQMAADHRDAIDLVKTVAAAVIAEATSWRNHVSALRKARDAEQKELERDAKRRKKKEDAKRKAEEAKQKREAEKKARQEKKEAEAADAAGPPEEVADGDGDDAGPKKRTRGPTAGRARSRGIQSEIDEADPALLQSWAASSTWPKENCMLIYDSTPELAGHIARTAGMVPAVARLRRSALKRIIDVRSLRGFVCTLFSTDYIHTLCVFFLSLSLSLSLRLSLPPSLSDCEL